MITAAPTVTPSTRTGFSRGTLVLALVVVALAAVTVALVSGWLRPLGVGSPEQVPAPMPVQAPAFQPGGSVYDQQVPGVGWSDTFGPGSVLYEEQVPSAARPDASAEQPRRYASFPVDGSNG